MAMPQPYPGLDVKAEPAARAVPQAGRVLREGVVAGVLGAATVALWFFALDLMRGRPLLTPMLLGAAVFQGATDPLAVQLAPGPILGYTLLHGLAFVAFGVIAASLIASSEREWSLFLVFLLLFAAFEVSFVGLVTAFSRSLVGEIVWWRVLVANVLASAAMLSYLFRLHPVAADRSPLAPVWFTSTVGLAAALTIHGIVIHGWSAISWLSALVWGGVAATAFLVVAIPLWAATGSVDFLDLLGSLVVRPGTMESRVLGAVLHHVNGAMLGVAWAYGTVVFDLPQSGTGLAWGLILWALSVVVVNTIGSVHPAIRRGELADPTSSIPSLIILLPHLVYGVVLDGLYHSWRLP